jgi:hypothetical protein
MKRYAVTIDLYVYAEYDEDAIKQADDIAKQMDLDNDNKATVQSIHEQSFGQLTSRKVK